MKYFAITKKLREAEPDSLDMALMCALSILTCDRGVPMPRSAVKKLYAIQVRILTFNLRRRLIYRQGINAPRTGGTTWF